MRLEKLNLTQRERKRKFLYGFICVVLLLIIIGLFLSHAKYRQTQSIQVATGTINYIKDIEPPVITKVESSKTATSITLNVTATDNVGVTKYFYSKDGGSNYTESTKSSYTFSSLIAGSYNVSIYVTDAAGNDSTAWTDTISTATAKDTILADNSGATVIQTKTAPNFANTSCAVRTNCEDKSSCSTSCNEKTNGIYAAKDADGTTYYYRGSVDNNWVQFGTDSSGNNLYWRIIRINGNGTIRLIYNGTATDQTGTGTQLSSTKTFNSRYNDNAYVGYMYGETATYVDNGQSSSTSSISMSSSLSYYYGTEYTFNETTGKYSLRGTLTSGVWSESFVNKYTCRTNTSGGTCTTLYYMTGYTSADAGVGYSYTRSVVGDDPYATTHTNTNSSAIKQYLDSWYESNLKTNYASYLDGNTGWCGDRTSNITEDDATTLGTSGGYGTTATYYGAYYRLIANKTPSYECSQSNDLYTTTGSTKGNKALTYPIGLITADEVAFAGGKYQSQNYSYWLYTGSSYWTMSPMSYNPNAPFPPQLGFVDRDYGVLGSYGTVNSIGVRPVINLKADTQFTGSGTTTDVYKVVGAS